MIIEWGPGWSSAWLLIEKCSVNGCCGEGWGSWLAFRSSPRPAARFLGVGVGVPEGASPKMRLPWPRLGKHLRAPMRPSCRREIEGSQDPWADPLPGSETHALGIPDTSLSGRSTRTALSVLRSNSVPTVAKMLEEARTESRRWVSGSERWVGGSMLWFLFFQGFNSRIAALQCCASFCCGTMWISHNYIYNQLYIYNWLTKSIFPKGNQSWIFTGRTDAKAEAPTLWPSDAKNWLIGKDSDAGKNGRQEEKGTTENEMVGWHHRLNGHEFEQAPGSWWWTGKPGVLHSMGLQRVGQNWETELTDWYIYTYICIYPHPLEPFCLLPSHSSR